MFDEANAHDGYVTRQEFYSPAIQQELEAYNDVPKDCYRPGPYNAKQLGKAILEFVRRWGGVGQETKSSDESPFVWAARDCPELPDKHMILSAQNHAGLYGNLSWLLYDGNLFITQLSHNRTHGAVFMKAIDYFKAYWDHYDDMEVGIVLYDVNNRLVVGNGWAAPDLCVSLDHPGRHRDDLRSPLVIEVENHNRGPRQLMELFHIYLQQPEVKYALALLFYPKMKDGPYKGHCAAIAVLWKHNYQGGFHQVDRIKSFGSAPLDSKAIEAFFNWGQVGTLALPEREQLLNHTPFGSPHNVITIPDDELIRGIQYPDPNNTDDLIQVPQQGRDFELDLNALFKRYMLALM